MVPTVLLLLICVIKFGVKGFISVFLQIGYIALLLLTVRYTNVTITIDENEGTIKNNYVYPNPTDKRVTDIFPILITEDRAIPFGVVAQRAMYEK